MKRSPWFRPLSVPLIPLLLLTQWVSVSLPQSAYAADSTQCRSIFSGFTGAVERCASYIKQNPVTFFPLAAIPAALAFHGDVPTATRAAAELIAGLAIIHAGVDHFVESVPHVVPPHLIPIITVLGTNIDEFGISQVSAWVGDPIYDVAATPMGSNPVNLLTGTLALLTSLRERAIHQNILQPKERWTVPTLQKTLQSINWKEIRRNSGTTIAFTLDALLFQALVRPEMMKGNYAPLAVWLTLNIPTSILFFRKAISLHGTPAEERIEAKEAARLIQIEHEIHREVAAENLAQANILAANPEFVGAVETTLKDLTPEERQAYADHQTEFTLEQEQLLTPAQKNMQIVRMIAAVAAMTLSSRFLDFGVTDVAQSLPFLTKSGLSFYALSFMASLGEFLVVRALFARGSDHDAGKSIATTTGMNMFLSQLAMGLSAGLSGLRHH